MSRHKSGRQSTSRNIRCNLIAEPHSNCPFQPQLEHVFNFMGSVSLAGDPGRVEKRGPSLTWL